MDDEKTPSNQASRCRRHRSHTHRGPRPGSHARNLGTGGHADGLDRQPVYCAVVLPEGPAPLGARVGHQTFTERLAEDSRLGGASAQTEQKNAGSDEIRQEGGASVALKLPSNITMLAAKPFLPNGFGAG